MRLCDEDPGLELVRAGDHFRLRILDESVVEVPLLRDHAREIIKGGTVQLSYPGIYCRIDGQGEQVKITYALRSHPLTCHVPLESFLQAVQE